MAHVGDLLAEMLVRYGVTHVFGQPGGQTAALYDGIARRSPRIRHILVRDERSAAYAADAFARLTGRPGVCDVTVGPGTTKLSDGLVESLNASVPVVRSEEHTSESSHLGISYAVFCLKKKNKMY